MTECVRKMILTGLLMFLMQNSITQLAFGLVVCFVSFGVFSYLEPFLDPNDDWMQMCSQFATFMVLLTGLLFKTGAIGADANCERYCNEIPESVAEPILVFVCVFPILVAVYVVYHDFKSIREDLKKVKELELVRAEARRRLSQVKGAAMATMALAATKSPSKRYAPGTGEESATSGDADESKTIEVLQSAEAEPAAVEAPPLEVESFVDVHEA